MNSNFITTRKAFFQCKEKCVEEKCAYLQCLKRLNRDYMHEHQYNVTLLKCQVILQNYLSCLNYKTAASIIEE